MDIYNIMNLSFVGQDVYTDLEFFNSFTNDYSQSIIYTIEKYTDNKACLQHIIQKLKQPTYNTHILKSRQTDLSRIIDIYENNKDNVNILTKTIKNCEDDVQWLFNQTNDEIIDILDIVYFKLYIFDKLNFNTNSYFLTLTNIYTIIGAPLLGVISPMLYFIIPYVVLVYKLKFKIPIKVFVKTIIQAFMKSSTIKNLVVFQLLTYGLSFFLYCQSLLNTYDLAKNTYKVATHIIQKVNNVLEYVEACEELNHLFKFSSKDNASLLNNIFDCRNNNINFGKKLVFFKQLNLEELRSYLHDSDSFLGNLAIARLQLSYNMCFTDYIEIKNTYIEARDMYHLSIENYVPNDIILNEQNVIITGPNAAGKSTFIKGLILNVILSQTYGIACASSFKLTPFYFINTQINIPDVKGKQSLFEAEMFRCKSNLDIITQLPDDKKALIVMDEVFSSTNVVEGVAGAYGILEKMSTYPNVCTIVTTHFLYLTKLKSFKKYKMNVEFEDEDTIKYPYRLDTGISKQLVAIELIKNNFDDDVINTALTIKNKLLV